MPGTGLLYELRLKDFFRKTMQGATDDTEKLDGKMNKLNKTASKIGASIAGFFAISKIKDFAIGVTMAAAAANSFDNAIIASSRTQGEGYANLQFLNQQVDRLGLNLQAARDGYKTFTGAVMGSSIQGKKANNIFRQVSEASAILGLSAEQTEGSFLALGQMISKGTVQAEELKGQLAERIPGAFQIGARAMGMSSKQLMEAMKEGLVQADDFLLKFGNELEKTFGSKLGSVTQSVQSNLNKMGNEWQRLQENIGKSNTGIIATTTNMATNVLRSINRVISGLNQMDLAFKVSGKSDELDFGFFENAQFYIDKISRSKAFKKFYSYNPLLAPLTAAGVGGSALGNKGKVEDAFKFQEELTKAVDMSAVSQRQSFLAEANLLKKKGALRGDLAGGKIDKLAFDRSIAMLDLALEQVIGNRTLNDANKSDKGKPGANGAGTQIGSPIDVSGPRPQNITINVNKLVETINITSETPVQGVAEARAITSKAFLELLNDANTMADN